MECPLGTPQKGGQALWRTFVPTLWLLILLTEDIQGWAGGFFQAHLAFGCSDLETVEAASLEPLPGHGGRNWANDSTPTSLPVALLLPEFLPPWKDRAAGLLFLAPAAFRCLLRSSGHRSRMTTPDVLHSSSFILGHPQITVSLGKTGNSFSDKWSCKMFREKFLLIPFIRACKARGG